MRLRRENRQLRMEREILSKAAAWFARETGSIPEKSSSLSKPGTTLIAVTPGWIILPLWRMKNSMQSTNVSQAVNRLRKRGNSTPITYETSET